MKHLSLFSVLFLLTGCQAIGNWADSVGEHMPVIGERCEHWQCFTQSGQHVSEENKEQRKPVNTAPMDATQNPIPASEEIPGAQPTPVSP